MKCLVTGAAGFVGSHLCERLVRDGCDVTGLDAFIPYYPRHVKDANIADVRSSRSFRLVTTDLRDAAIDDVLDGVDFIFHLAAMPGLPRSWTDFQLYESCNVTSTQRLIAAAVNCRTLKRFIYASTSSVYGRFGSGDESLPTRPISPYGVTKLAAENLCRAYADEFGLPLVVLRYFSIYGPRQRPDMGYHKFIDSLLTDSTITVFGDGHQVRGNTFIDDCVAATVKAVDSHVGEVYNVGGGETASVWDILHQLESITGRIAHIERKEARPGDQRSTTADTAKINRHLGWRPKVSLADGLLRQVAWQRSMTSVLSKAA